MKYLAIKIKGEVELVNNIDELGGLIDLDIDHEILGTVCDDKEFGDRCTTDCYAYRHGICRSKIIRDSDGKRGHLI